MIKFDGFNGAILYIGRRFSDEVVVYDYDKCVEILVKRDKMDADDAVEWIEYNMIGAYLGEQTPIFVSAFDEFEIGDEIDND
jgi:hypothetical protein